MKMLTVSALVCAMMVLTGAAESHRVKRTITCSSGVPSSSRVYYFVSKPVTWAEAEKECQSSSGHLASIHDLEEYGEIQWMTDEPTWVGGSDAQAEGQWVWSDGSPFNYNNWCPGEPNNGRGGQHCLQINHKAEKCWDDVECSSKLPFLCVIIC